MIRGWDEEDHPQGHWKEHKTEQDGKLHSTTEIKEELVESKNPVYTYCKLHIQNKNVKKLSSKSHTLPFVRVTVHLCTCLKHLLLRLFKVGKDYSDLGFSASTSEVCGLGQPQCF